MPLLRAQDSVLVVVDAQAGFVCHDGMDAETRAIASATVDRIAWLVRVADLLGVPALITEEGAGRNGATDERIVRRAADATATVARTTFGLTGSEEAVAWVAASGRQIVVLTGFETDVCVAQSGAGLVDLGYRVVVPVDAAYSSNATEHHHGLERLRSAGAGFSSTKGVTFEWLETIPAARDVVPRARRDFDELPWRYAAPPVLAPFRLTPP